MMLKKILFGILLQFATVCFGREQYEVVLLGDLHYAAEDIVERDKITRHRNNLLNGYLQAWEKHIPKVLRRAAEYSAKDNVLFTVQCGDITNGDEGNYEFSRSCFERVLKLVNQDQKKSVYVVRGNHDLEGKDKDKACRDVLDEYMKKQDVIFPLPGKDQTCCKIVGRDLFIFYDGMKESLEALEAALKVKPDARHIFLVTHLPVMPCRFSPAAIHYICGRYSKNGDKIRALMIKNNVIVLAAHTHLTSYFDWKTPEGSLKQFVSFSVVRDPEIKPEKIDYTGTEYFQHFEKNYYPILGEKDRIDLQNVLKRYVGKLESCVHYKDVSGFNVLRVAGDNVYVDVYCGKLDKALYTQKIK